VINSLTPVNNTASYQNSSSIQANNTISNIFSEMLSEAQGKSIAAKSAEQGQIPIQSTESIKPVMVTDKGNIAIDLDSYFSNESVSTGFLNLDELPPFFMPSAQNIKALSEHVSVRFKAMLSDYNIPSAPDKITYDNAGKMQIPVDYPYANELNQALKENPGINRELSTINALSSHYVAIQERMPFIEAMGQANSQAEKDFLIAKYSHLLQDNHSYKSLALLFSKEGDLSVTVDDKPVKFS